MGLWFQYLFNAFILPMGNRKALSLNILKFSRIMRKSVFGSDTNWAVQPQKMARWLKVWIYEEGLY